MKNHEIFHTKMFNIINLSIYVTDLKNEKAQEMKFIV